MGRKTQEAFDKLLDSLPSTGEGNRDPFSELIEKFPSRVMSNPERRGAMGISWTHEWPFYEVTFTGWTGAAGMREVELVRALRALGDEAVKAKFAEVQGYATVLVSIDYGDMAESGETGLDRFRNALNLVRPYRVVSGYTWVAYEDVEEALRD